MECHMLIPEVIRILHDGTIKVMYTSTNSHGFSSPIDLRPYDGQQEKKPEEDADLPSLKKSSE